MKSHILKGTNAEIAEALAKIEGEISQVVVLIDEPEDLGPPIPPGADFSEMDPYMVQAGGNVDYSREAIYSRDDE